MKKTLTINISGLVFTIDEDAYEKLKSYLSKISSHFSKEESGHEIIGDIESRIAELFRSKINPEQSVIDEPMVDQIIAIMGSPEDFSEADENNPKEKEKKENENYPGKDTRNTKKLYRDPESRFIGGVCSGLSHYLNIDKLLVRIIFIVLFIATSGVALPVYIILWIAVPNAKTTAQRLEMMGEPINVENIEKKVKEESSNPSKESYRASQPERTAKNEGSSVLLKIVGIILLFIGFSSLMGLLFGLVAASKFTGLLHGSLINIDHNFVLNQIISQSTGTTLLLSMLIIVGIPLLLIIYSGTKLLFNFVSNSRSVYLSALGIWIIGIIIAISTTIGAVDDFSSNATLTDKKEIAILSDTLYLEMNTNTFNHSTMKVGINNMQVMVVDDNEVLVANPKFDIEKSENNRTELIFNKYSKGSNERSASKNAGLIEYKYQIKENTLLLDPYFTLGKNKKWRSQELKITLKIPEGTIVYLNDNLLPIIHNIENTSHTWDGDMVGNYWIMKPEGLTLLEKTTKK
ncbi:MAG TPA: PspC domain-containing protein [Prolixibacteraceae bacterium]|nr:PspC domain-containing protein [Prolixibacteraceae bacterium]